jgi:hypothetical protein
VAEVIVGGAFALVTALVSGWLVEGGRRRRARKAIREEYELAKDLDPAWPETARLRAQAQRRLDRYVTPLPEKFRRLTTGERATTVIVTFGLVVAGAAAGSAVALSDFRFDTGDELGNGLTVAGAVGAIAGITLVVLEAGLTSVVEAVSRLMKAVWRTVKVLTVKWFSLVKQDFRTIWSSTLGGRATPRALKRKGRAKGDK